ncbi:DHBP synthase RibB-like alpha/beta domain-containing protein [Globomyces pollinis-pini]|nr:DHBP synthase RibB-like alpha/beta domain-containing protein [Globomyces pollinis-pini]
METILQKINNNKPLEEQLDHAADILRKGGLVSFPTETVYGLGANALDSDAVAKIFIAKNRPQDNPLIVHVSDLEMLNSFLAPQSIPNIYLDLIHQEWPGPLTILCEKPEILPLSVSAGQNTVAIRIPAHPVARALIKKCGFPLAAPSANTSGRPSPTLANHVFEEMNGRIPLVIDGGPCESGVESTVLDGLRTPPAILRPGGVTVETIRQYIPQVLVYRKDFVDAGLEAAPSTPGMKYRHYTPNAEVVVVELGADDGALVRQEDVLHQQYIKYSTEGGQVGVLKVGGSQYYPQYPLQFDLGVSANEVARNLFNGLRDLERNGANVILVQGITEASEGLAVMNRVRKAASKCIAS